MRLVTAPASITVMRFTSLAATGMLNLYSISSFSFSSFLCASASLLPPCVPPLLAFPPSQAGSFREADACFVLGEILLGLSHCHCRGVVYNDLKPENVLCHESGHFKLVDFGAAQLVKGEGHLQGDAGDDSTTMSPCSSSDTLAFTLRSPASQSSSSCPAHAGLPPDAGTSSVAERKATPGDATAAAEGQTGGQAGRAGQRRVEGTLEYLSPEVVR